MAGWAALLSIVAGYVDAICYLDLGNAFAANMTGNLVVAGIAAARGEWRQTGWFAAILLAFLVGVLAARLVPRAHRSPRVSFLFEAALIGAAASGLLGDAAVAVLAAAMALQNEAGLHGFVSVNVAFITGDIQQLGERLVDETMPRSRAKRDRTPRIILVVLACYALGAALGAWGAAWGAPALAAAASVMLAAAVPAGRIKPVADSG